MEERRKNKEKKGKLFRIFWTTEKLDYLLSVSVHFHSPIFSIYQSCFFTKLLLFKEKNIHHSTCPKLYLTLHAIILRICESVFKMWLIESLSIALLELPVFPSLNAQSCNKGPICSTFRFENLHSPKKTFLLKNYFLKNFGKNFLTSFYVAF